MPKHRGEIGYSGRGIGGKQIAVGPVFDPVAPRILPIVEHLTAKDVAADSPIVRVLLQLQVLVPNHKVIQIKHLERSMMKRWRLTGYGCEVQAVVIGQFGSAIAPNECGGEISVRRTNFVGHDEAEARLPPFPGYLRARDRKNEMSKTDDLRWAIRQALGVCFSRLLRLIVPYRRRSPR